MPSALGLGVKLISLLPVKHFVHPLTSANLQPKLLSGERLNKTKKNVKILKGLMKDK